VLLFKPILVFFMYFPGDPFPFSGSYYFSRGGKLVLSFIVFLKELFVRFECNSFFKIWLAANCISASIIGSFAIYNYKIKLT